MAKAFHIAVILILALSIVLSCTVLANKLTDPTSYTHTIEVLDDNRATVLGLSAASAAASAAISALPDDICSPLAEQISEFTTWFLLILSVIYLEKYLLTIFGATIFGVYFKLQSITFMPVFGMNNAVIPIIGYNYGARNRKRMLQAIRLATVYVCGFMVLGLLLMQIFPKQLLGIFESDPEILNMGATALRAISLSFPLAGVCIALGSVFQALGKGTYSLIVSVARQLVVLVPVAFLLSLSGNLSLIWLSFPIAELASLTATLIMYRRINSKIISKLSEND